MKQPEFTVGTSKLHDNPNFNYQLNRYALRAAGEQEVKALAAQIHDIPSIISVMRTAAEKAIAEKRNKVAIAYILIADFFMLAEDPAKMDLYKEYKRLFNEENAELLSENNVKRADVPYEEGTLPVYYMEPEKEALDTIVIHGGFDSYAEEFLPMAIYLYQKGYAVYLFEGPGQGECIIYQNMPFTPDWHKPVAAVLDHFNLDDVTLMGYSLGSLLAKRAAAGEHRIKRLAAIGFMASHYDTSISSQPKEIADEIRKLLEQEKADEINKRIYDLMEKSTRQSWRFNHGMRVYGVKTPYEFLQKMKLFDLANVADTITQDYFVAGGTGDHIIPISTCQDELNLLKNVRTYSCRVFTEHDQAENHCGAGNTKLVLDVFIRWLEGLEAERSSKA